MTRDSDYVFHIGLAAAGILATVQTVSDLGLRDPRPASRRWRVLPRTKTPAEIKKQAKRKAQRKARQTTKRNR